MLFRSRYRADKAFVGVGGISPENGLSAVSEKEAEMTKAMSENSQVTYLLCDSSKLGKNKYLAFAPLSIIDVLVTDEQTEEVINKYRKIGVKVLNS